MSKASSETDAEVGDRTNDRVRVNATEVRARVVGEGGNRGFTQKGRIEYWMHGGLINTDALDNSGGVDTSDHEVNHQDPARHSGKKRDRQKQGGRANRILSEMTEEVAALVLADNENQSRALTLDGLRSAAHYEAFVHLIDEMKVQRHHGPTRTLRFQPATELLRRAIKRVEDCRGRCLRIFWDTRRCGDSTDPASATSGQRVAPRSWMRISQSGCSGTFHRYFPEHPLRREIIATAVINYVVNNGGIALFSRLLAASKATPSEAILAYLTADRQSNAFSQRQRTLQVGLTAEAEHKALFKIEDALESAARNLLAGKAAK